MYIMMRLKQMSVSVAKYYNKCQPHRFVHYKTPVTPQDVLHLNERELFTDMFPPATTAVTKDILKKQCFYCGFDPTANSLHVGNLLSLIALLHCQKAGTATSLVGDPSDHQEDRKLLTKDQIHKNADSIENLIKAIFNNYSEEIYENKEIKQLSKLRVLKNNEWYDKINIIDFTSMAIRSFRMKFLLGQRFIRERLKGKSGLATSEFLYPIFQAYDWLHLYNNYNCRFQIGGLDQLGNIHAGHDLVKSEAGIDAFGLLVPIVTNHLGKKLGKSQDNAVWLSADKSSPFELYQYFIKQPDSVVENLKQIKEVMAAHNRTPEQRNAQSVLARHVCKLVHGSQGLESAQRCTRVLYEGELSEVETLDDNEILTTFSGMKIYKSFLQPDTTVLDVLLLVKGHKNEKICKEMTAKGAVKLNGCIMKVPEQILLSGLHILKNNLTLLTIGKTTHHIIKWIN